MTFYKKTKYDFLYIDIDMNIDIDISVDIDVVLSEKGKMRELAENRISGVHACMHARMPQFVSNSL